MKTRNNWLWQPPNETIDAIATVLSSHWAAAKTQQVGLFTLRAGNWLRLGRLTTSRAAADSSGRLPDPRPC